MSSSRAGKPQESVRADAAPESALLARVLDDIFTIPGTSIGVGVDGLLGLVPGVGDGLTTALASTMLLDAVRRRVPVSVLSRMALNLLIDTALGWLPFLGDAADFAHRANRKNYALLRGCIERGEYDESSYPAYLAKALTVVVAVLMVMVVSAVAAVWLLLRLLGLTG